LTSALTIAASYIVGGMIPLTPYMLVPHAVPALRWSVGVTLLALLVFGWMKGRFTGARPARSAGQTMLVGGIAAAAAFGLAKLFS
jgi:VIT1/CCC1 family predicted Fe2+/Mn2+ transporter